MNCNTCGSEVFGDSVFCDSCGAIIENTAAPPAAQTDSAAFEPTQMIPVADEAPPAYPPAPSVPPAPQAPQAPAHQPPQPVPAEAQRSPRRPAGPAYVSQPRRSTIPIIAGALLFVGLVILAFVIRGAFTGNDDDADQGDDVAAVDETADPEAGDSAGDESDTGDTAGEPADDGSLPGAAAVEVPDGFVLYDGACFAAAIPESWVLTEDAGIRSYGRRTAWSRGAEELFVDTSPLRDATVTGRQAADEQLNNRTTATSGLREEPGRDDMWSYTYTRSGTPSIAIYFVEERGFGIVGSSSEDPDGVIGEARTVSASIQVTDPDC